MSCLKSLSHLLCGFVVAYPEVLFLTQRTLNIVDGSVIQLDLVVVIISESGPRLRKTFIIQWNIVTMFYNIPDAKTISLNIVLHSEFPEWIVVSIETRRLVWRHRDIRETALISIHHWIFSF